MTQTTSELMQRIVVSKGTDITAITELLRLEIARRVGDDKAGFIIVKHQFNMKRYGVK